MMNYVVGLTLFPNLKVLVLAEILDLPCPNIFNFINLLLEYVQKWKHRKDQNRFSGAVTFTINPSIRSNGAAITSNVCVKFENSLSS